MEVLSLDYEIFLLMWIIPQPKSESRWLRVRNILFSMGCFSGVFFELLTSIAFVHQNLTIDLESSLYALFQISGHGCQNYLMIIGHLTWRKFANMFRNNRKSMMKVSIRKIAFGTWTFYRWMIIGVNLRY